MDEEITDVEGRMAITRFFLSEVLEEGRKWRGTIHLYPRVGLSRKSETNEFSVKFILLCLQIYSNEVLPYFEQYTRDLHAKHGRLNVDNELLIMRALYVAFRGFFQKERPT